MKNNHGMRRFAGKAIQSYITDNYSSELITFGGVTQPMKRHE